MNKVINIILSLILILSLTSCWPIAYLFNKEPNRFFLNSQPFTYFGKYSGYGDYAKECRNLNPPHPDYFSQDLMIYKNNVPTTRTCVSYQRYLCHTNITCKKHQSQEERKKCELDAESYFLGRYLNKNDYELIKSNKTYCDRIKKQCDAAPKDDYSCRR